jgi:glucose-6-phosphate isomerase
MPNSAAWSRYCQYLVTDRELGFSLDISRVDFKEADFAPLIPRISAAVGQMALLEQGAISNADEHRMVGHYWLRAPELAPTAAITAEIQQTQASIREFARQIHAGEIEGADGRFQFLLLIGIGGSALGPQFVANALGTPLDEILPFFIDNTDPDGIDQILGELDGQLGKTLVLVISKSGGTPETRNGMLEVERAYKAAELNFAEHAVAVTQTGSKLAQVATKNSWLKTFPMWDWVGGRTSVLSAVGLLPAALQGIPVEELLAGAAAMDRLTRTTDPWKNPAALLAMVWYHTGQGRGVKDMVILPYKDRLCLFSRYLQQLVMESLGKELDRQGKVVHQGIAVYGNKGSTDQHAYVQQLRDGIANFFATFIEVLKDRDEPSTEVEPGITSGDYLHGLFLGTRDALGENHRDTITITIQSVNGRSVGALIALYERAVGLYAELINVNAYHQPGVEAGKAAAAAVLSLQAKVLAKLSSAPQTAEQLAKSLNLNGQTEWIFKILQHLSANPDRGIVHLPGATPAEARFRTLG